MSEIKQTIIEHPSDAKSVIPDNFYEMTLTEWENYGSVWGEYYDCHARHTARECAEDVPELYYESAGCHRMLRYLVRSDTFFSNIIMKNDSEYTKKFYNWLYNPETSPFKLALQDSYIVMKDKRPIMIFWPNIQNLPAKLWSNMLIMGRHSSQYARAQEVDIFVNEYGLSMEEAISLGSMYAICASNEKSGKRNRELYKAYYSNGVTNGLLYGNCHEMPGGDSAFTHDILGYQYPDNPRGSALSFSPYHFIRHDFTPEALVPFKKGSVQPCNNIWRRRKKAIIEHEKCCSYEKNYGGRRVFRYYQYQNRKHFYPIMTQAYKNNLRDIPKEFISQIKEVFNSEKEMQIDP